MSFEQRETWRISRRDGIDAVECPFCPSSSPMIAAETLARLAGISPRAVYRRVDGGGLHFVETPELELLVCLRSFVEKIDGTMLNTSAAQLVGDSKDPV